MMASAQVSSSALCRVHGRVDAVGQGKMGDGKQQDLVPRFLQESSRPGRSRRGAAPATHTEAAKPKQRTKSSGAEAQPAGTPLGIKGTEEMGDRLPLRKANGNSQECPYVV